MRWPCFTVAALVGCGFQVEGVSPDDASSGDASSGDAPSTADAAPKTLTDRGLVVRYFMDEAAGGRTPTNLTDAAPNPLALPITYGQATFSEVNGNRGLTWGVSQGTGKAEITFGSTKLNTRLGSAMTVTIEVVVEIKAGGSSGSESHIAGLRGLNPDLILTAIGSTDIVFFKPYNSVGATWLGVGAQQRMVLHLVFDTTRPTPDERIELFKDGVTLAKNTSFPPLMNSTVMAGGNEELMIGNRQDQMRSIAGTIFYVAYYDVALDATEIANNTQRLLASDDL